MELTCNLCKCLKCDVVMFDQNPQVRANEHPIPDNAMEMKEIADEGGVYFVCPVCGDDGNLIDL